MMLLMIILVVVLIAVFGWFTQIGGTQVIGVGSK
jgi:hypothetical protein